MRSFATVVGRRNLWTLSLAIVAASGCSERATTDAECSGGRCLDLGGFEGCTGKVCAVDCPGASDTIEPDYADVLCSSWAPALSDADCSRAADDSFVCTYGDWVSAFCR